MLSNIFVVLYNCRDSNERYRQCRNRLCISKNTLKFKGKGQTAVISSIFSFHIVSKVTYLASFSHPAHSSVQSVSLGIDQGFHSYIVKAVRFEEVDDVEAIFYIFSGVCH